MRESADIKFFEGRSRGYRLPCSSLLVCLLALLLLVESSNGQGNYSRLEYVLSSFFVKTFDPSNIDFVSETCRKDAALYHKALSNYDPWAIQMFDASTKIPEGLVTGNTKQLGHYDECLRIRTDYGFVGKACTPQVQFFIYEQPEDTEKDEFSMADMLIKASKASGIKNWTIGSSVPYEWLWCVPSTCSPDDIAKAIDVGLSALKRKPRVNFTVQIDENSCHTEDTDSLHLDQTDWIFLSLLTFFASLVVISTTYDLMKQRNTIKPDFSDTKHIVLSSFSVHTNCKLLLNTKRGPDIIPCLDGLRFLSICWIICSHTYYVKIVAVELDLLPVASMHENWSALFILNGNVATDIFLLLSGILLATAELNRKEKLFRRYRFNVLNLYLRRYFRLTPAYAIVIGFYATLFYKTGNGPRWHSIINANRVNCRENFWTNLLYVNNYVNVDKMCMSQSWYLSVDMQLFWFSPIFLISMLSNGKKSQVIFFTTLSLALIASVLAPFFITFFKDLTGTMLYYKNQNDVEKVYVQIYLRAYNRAAPYLLGIGIGYLLKKIKLNDVSASATFVIIGWLVGIATALAVIFGPQGMYYPEHQYNSLEAAFYAGLHRPAFAIAIGWIIVACVFGFAGPVGVFLSWKCWTPLSRLTYAIYLTHFIVLLYDVGIARTPGHLTLFKTTQIFFGNLAMTIGIALALSLTFEIPTVRLISLLFSKFPSDSKSLVKRDRPVISEFETSQSSFEIYNSFDETPSTISRTYDDLVNGEKLMDVRSKWRKKGSGNLSEPGSSCPDETSSAYSEPSYVRNKKQLPSWSQKYRV